MLWFFARGQQAIRIETRYDAGTKEYVLDIDWADRPPDTERFGDVEAFRARVIALERQLKDEAWMQVGRPEILPPVWRGPFTS
jgi:hypothetical protein